MVYPRLSYRRPIPILSTERYYICCKASYDFFIFPETNDMEFHYKHHIFSLHLIASGTPLVPLNYLRDIQLYTFCTINWGQLANSLADGATRVQD